MTQRYFHVASPRDATLFACCVTPWRNVVSMLRHTVAHVIFMLRHIVTQRISISIDATLFSCCVNCYFHATSHRHIHAASHRDATQLSCYVTPCRNVIYMLRHTATLFTRCITPCPSVITCYHTVTQRYFHAASHRDAALF